MPMYIIDIEKTKNFHFYLQHKIFDHCEDFECWGDDMTEEEEKLHCLKCDYYNICRLSNEITYKIYKGEFS